MATKTAAASPAANASESLQDDHSEKPDARRCFGLLPPRKRPPILLKARSSVFFITLVVGFGVFCDLCIYGIASPVIPFRLQQLGYADVSSLTGWLVAAYGGALVVSSPFAGYLGERIPSRQGPLLFCLIFMAGSLVMFMLSKTFALLLVSRILQGFSGTGIFTLGFALLADVVDEDRIALASGYALIGMSLGGVAGPPIGGVLYHRLGYYAPWIFSLSIVAVDGLLRLLILEPHQVYKWLRFSNDKNGLQTQPKKLRKAASWRGFLKLAYNLRAGVSFLISFSLGIYFGGVLDSAMTIRLNQRYGLTSEGAGLVFIANAVPAAIVGPIAGILVDKYGPKWIALVGCVSTCPVLALLCINQLPLWGFCVVLAAVGFVSSIALPAVSADLFEVAQITPEVGFAHVFSYFNLSFSVGAFIGPIIAGQVLQGLGTENGWYTMVGISVFFYLLSIPGILWKYTTKGEAPIAPVEATA